MNAAYINPFLTATINLFEQAYGFAPTVGDLYLEDRLLKHRWDISAVMVLTGNAIGVVAIRLTRYLADKLLSRTGVEWKDDNERENLMAGMVSELINVVASRASAELKDYKIEISVPLVIQGENHTVSWPDDAPIIAIPFTTPYGPFVVNVSLIEIPSAYIVKK